MKNSRRLWKRWCVVFAGQFVSICVCIYMILVIGKFVCEHMNRIWYSEDLTYILLKWIDDNQGAILLFIMLVSAVLLTIYRLEELTNEFFDITRFNFSHMILNKSSVNLSIMLQQILSEFMTEFKKKGLEITCKVEPDCWLLCDAEKLERVFDNILKNLINYSYPNTQIRISLRRLRENKLEMITENRGKTIPKEMQEHIFEQFFRLDSSRASQSGGAGIGLAVAKEIVTLHGGEISCKSEDEIIWFKMILPACQRSLS